MRVSFALYALWLGPTRQLPGVSEMLIVVLTAMLADHAMVRGHDDIGSRPRGSFASG